MPPAEAVLHASLSMRSLPPMTDSTSSPTLKRDLDSAAVVPAASTVSASGSGSSEEIEGNKPRLSSLHSVFSVTGTSSGVRLSTQGGIEDNTETTPRTSTVSATSSIPVWRGKESSRRGSLAESVFDEPESEENVLRGPDGEVLAATLPKLIAAITTCDSCTVRICMRV